MSGEAVSLNTVLEDVDTLDLEDQQYVQEIIRHRLIDAKRLALAGRAKHARTSARKNQCKTGTARDLLADLNLK